jgi:hypothetical protein
MDRPLLIVRRQQLSWLLITTVAFVLSLSSVATCAPVNATQDVLHSDHKFEITGLVNSSHSNVTKDTNLYRNSTQWLYGASTESIEISTVHDLPLEINSNLNYSLSSGLTVLKVISSITQDCRNASDVIKCFRVKVIEFMRSILYSAEPYGEPHDFQSNELQNDEILDIAERNITLLLKIIMKEIRNHVMSMNWVEIENGVEDSARAALSWFTPGKQPDA